MSIAPNPRSISPSEQCARVLFIPTLRAVFIRGARQFVLSVGLFLGVWCIVTTIGCAADGGAAQVQTDLNQAGSDVDPSRAHLSLNDIKPRPIAPTAPADVKPLSERAAKQIVKAKTLIADQRYTEAAIQLERALRYDPNHPAIHRTLAELHWDAGNLDRARSHVTLALEQNGNDSAAQYILGRTLALDGDRVAAMAAFRTAMLCADYQADHKRAALISYHLATILAEEGYLNAAIEQYTQFEQHAALVDISDTDTELSSLVDPGVGTVARAKADLFERLGQFSEAANALAALAESPSSDAQLLRRYAHLLLRAGRSNDAIAAAKRFSLDTEDDVALLFEIHQSSGHPERMVDDLKTRIEGHSESARLLLSLADVYGRLDRLGEARQVLSAFLTKHQDANEVRLALFDVLIEQGNWADAFRIGSDRVNDDGDGIEQFLQRAKTLAVGSDGVQRLIEAPTGSVSPTDSFLRGALAAELGRADLALRWLQYSYDQAPEFVPCRVALAQVLFDQYRYDEALAVGRRRNPDTAEAPEWEFILGRIYERLDNTKQAEMHFNAVIQADRSNLDAAFALAKLFHQTGQTLRAQRQLQVLLERDPNHEAARELLAYLYLADNKLDVALQHLEELQRRAKTPLVKARCAAFLSQVHQQDSDAYRQALLDAIKKYGSDADTWIALAQDYHRNTETLDRRDAYRHALEADPGNEEAAVGLVDTSRRLLDFDESINLLESLLKRRPNRHAWRLGANRRTRTGQRFPGLIELYRYVLDFDAALASARGALKNDDLDDQTRTRYRIEVLETLREAQRHDEAVAQIEAWLADDPDNGLLQGSLVSAYQRSDHAELAVPIAEGIFKKTPNWRTLVGLTDALVRVEAYDRAGQYLLDWLDSDPQNDNALLALTDVVARAGDTDGALELLHNRLPETMYRPNFQDQIVAILNRADRNDDAIEYVETLMDTVYRLLDPGEDPNSRMRPDRLDPQERARLPRGPFELDQLHGRLVRLRTLLVRLLFAQRDYRGAERELRSWLDAARDPATRLGYLLELASAVRLRGDEVEATQIQSRALLLQPGHIGLNNDVAYQWIDQGIRLDEAERMIRIALSAAPQQSAYLDTYGWLLYKKGDFAGAQMWLRRALQTSGGADPVLHDHLGDALWRLGKADAAVEQWKEAMKIIEELPPDRPLSGDQRRAKVGAALKIERGAAGQQPAVAALGGSPEPRASEQR